MKFNSFCLRFFRYILNSISSSLVLAVFFFLLILQPIKIFSQKTKDISELPFINQLIEDFISNNDEVEIDPILLWDQLNDLSKNPLDLNKSDRSQWNLLFFLDDPSIDAIFDYRQKYGPFLSVLELQAVPELNIDQIRSIRPFVTVDEESLTYQVGLLEMVKNGKNDLFLRTERIIEKQRGYDPALKDQGSSYYLGDQMKYLMRFRHQYSNKLSIFFAAEKDPGEPIFNSYNPNGFDYYTGHIFLRDYSRLIRGVAIGDYNISMGQGLIQHNGFGYGKSSSAATIKKTGPALQPYTSTLENSFFRGGATTLGFKNLELTLFGSYRTLDANEIQPDSIIEFDISFSSLQTSGFHRTQSELDDKDALKVFHTGSVIKYSFGRKGHIALNSLYTSFDQTYIKPPRPDNLFAFQGKSLTNISTDYSYIFRNFHFFGEIAKSNSSQLAFVSGLLLGLDRHIDLAILYRNLPKNYQALNSSAFAESSSGNNENGLYIGTRISPNKFWIIEAYSDIWQHPWLKFNINRPSGGNEQLVKITYTLKRKLDVYFQFRNEMKDQNIGSDETLIAVLPQNRQQFRLNLNHKITKRIEMRYRTEWSYFKSANGQESKGFMIYQDILYKPINFPVAFTSRLAFFDTDGYDSRIYAYENDILYSFSVPAYYNNGMRWYINTRTRLSRFLTLEASISRTLFIDQTSFGSGLEQINGPQRTEAKLQLKMSF